MEWYLIIDGVRRGPMSKASVQALIAKGVVKPTTPARRPDMSEWFPIGYIKEFGMLVPEDAAAARPAPAPDAAASPPLAAPPPPPPQHDTSAVEEAEWPPLLPAAAAAAQNPFLGRGYWGRHWRGEYSLPVSYWLNWTLLGLAVSALTDQALERAMQRTLVSDDPRLLYLAMAALGLFTLLLAIWQMTGVARSAIRTKRETGAGLWPNAALAIVLLSALFYTVLTCMVVPAIPRMVSLFFSSDAGRYRVELSADGREVQVSGWLGLGVAGDVHKLLGQHPGVTRIALDSGTGRASAGVALGRLLADGRYTTIVRGTCASPCSTAFAGGTTRLLAFGGVLAFHQPVSGAGGNDDLGAITDATAAFLGQRGIAGGFIEKAFSREDAEQWAPAPRELFESGVIGGVEIAGAVVDAQAYPQASVQAILDRTAATPPFKALLALDAAAFDASQARLRKQLQDDGSGDPDAAGYRHAVGRELHDAALRYLPVTSDAAAAQYLKADLDQLRVLRNSDAGVCRALIDPQFGAAGDPAGYLTEATQDAYSAALATVLVDAQAGDHKPLRDAQSAADRQQVLASVLGRYPPVFAAGIGHPEELRALDALSVCAFHIALREGILALPAPRNGAALRRMTAEVLGR